MEFGVQGPEQRIRDNPFISGGAWRFESCIHHTLHLEQRRAGPLVRIGNGRQKTTRRAGRE
jgi:hypothetical protein